MSYYLGKVLVLCFDDSVRRVTEALKLAGFGMIPRRQKSISSISSSG